jgi:aspartyl/glutamyl-tRNA(Asn/Gln) amidotransferase C subunit
MNIEKLAQLARINLNKTEEKKLQKDIEAILDFVSKLKELPDENIKEIVSENFNSFREDELQKKEEHIAKLVEAAPQKEKGYIKVKNIFENNG